MNEFIQMDVFFFISSITSLIFLFFITSIGVYICLIFRKINTIVKEFKNLSLHVSQQGKNASDQLYSKFETILKSTGVIEKIVTAVVGSVLAYIVRGTIKKEARKKKSN